jgi:hypothetical protein
MNRGRGNHMQKYLNDKLESSEEDCEGDDEESS